MERGGKKGQHSGGEKRQGNNRGRGKQQRGGGQSGGNANKEPIGESQQVWPSLGRPSVQTQCGQGGSAPTTPGEATSSSGGGTPVESNVKSPLAWTTSPPAWTTSPPAWTTSPPAWQTSPPAWTTSPPAWTTSPSAWSISPHASGQPPATPSPQTGTTKPGGTPSYRSPNLATPSPQTGTSKPRGTPSYCSPNLATPSPQTGTSKPRGTPSYCSPNLATPSPQAGTSKPRGTPSYRSPNLATPSPQTGTPKPKGTPSYRSPNPNIGACSRPSPRGAKRGKRRKEEFLVHTKPATIVRKQGTSGRTITVQTNYFWIKKTMHWSIHQYRIDFAPDVEMVGQRHAYLESLREKFGDRNSYIFDGTMLFTTTYVPEAREASMEFLTKNSEGETIQIKVRHVGIVDSTDIQQLHVLNLIMRRSMQGLELKLLNRNYFDESAKITLPNIHLEIWPGYITSIRQHEQEILLCCEVSHKVLRTDSVLQIWEKCKSRPNFRAYFKQAVIGTIVMTKYNNKTYRIDEVNFDLNPESNFRLKDGQATSYRKYYLKAYGIKILKDDQPMLVSRPTERSIRGSNLESIHLVPELAYSTGLTESMRKDFGLMKQVSETTRLKPDERIQRLITFNERLHTKASKDNLQKWQMQLDSNLVKVKARILNSGNIILRNKKNRGIDGVDCKDDANWTRDLSGRYMLEVKELRNWCVIVPVEQKKNFEGFISICKNAASQMGMKVNDPVYQCISKDDISLYQSAITKAYNKDCQLIMLVLRDFSDEKYACIKRICCIDQPIPTQVCTLRTMSKKGLPSIATKVVIQMNAKLGGIPWNIKLLQNEEIIMFVGFDVCHSAKGRNNSYGALVASMDTRISGKYYSTVTKHLKGQEISNEIVIGVTNALTAFKQEHKVLPHRIIFYRDGVGDGQLSEVYNIEIKILSKKLEEIYSACGRPCKMAFVVVSKRINTRYFADGRNPIPGTVVDDVITLPQRYDFFLVSQAVNQGTVSPTSYNIIHDTSGLGVDRLQNITYAQTHMYFNWSGTCRVPAVCQYAHKLAGLVSDSLQRNPHDMLRKQLFFL